MRHRLRPEFAARHPCLVTWKVREGIASLRSGRVVKALEGVFARVGERPGFRLVHYSIQGDHLHALVEAEGRFALGRGMRALAIGLAQAVNRALGRSGGVLRDRYHLRVLRTPTQVRNALRYVLLNARRHWAKRRGRRELPEPVQIDPASSGRWFRGWRPGSVGADEAAGCREAPVVCAPRSWLLAVGWRRLGLLDPAEVPG